MQITRNRTMATMIALFLVLTVAVTLVALPAANAHTPAWEIPTFAYISVSPNPVGVGQQVIIVIWLDKVISGAAVANNIRMHDYKLTITKPDKTTETINWSVVVDTTSSQYTLYTPDQVGTYTLKFEYPGQTYNWSGAYNNDKYLPSSKTTTLTVQQESIPAKITYPLPTEYWTRPIEGQNTAWASVASNYLRPFGAAYSPSERFQPDGTAPNSPHIMWTKPINFGGVVGGSNVGETGATFYTGLSYNTRFNSPIIMNGRLYYELPSGNSGSGGGYLCVDLRTGEEIWWINITGRNIPRFGYLYNFDMYNQHGVVPDGWLFTSNFATAYDPRTGALVTLSLSNVPSGTAILGPSGEELRYTIDNVGTVANPDWRLAQWNSSKVFDVQSSRTIDASSASSYDWTVSIEALPTGSAIRYAILDDVILGIAGWSSSFGMANFGGIGTGATVSYATVWAISLKPDSRGSLLWIKNYSAPAGNITRQFGPLDPVNRVFLMSDKETMQWSGYSLDNGSLLWGPLGKTRDFNYYPTVGSGGVSQVGFCAYGNLYTGGYGGELFCYSTNNGTLLWKYNNTNSGLETPWGLYPLFPAAICDDKIYVYTNEHSPNTPYYKGARVRCINATTGEEIWTMLGHAGVGGFSDEGWPVADGFIVYLDYYDMQIYCIGKGPSSTTVEAPLTAITAGNSMVIQGTVTDVSAGTEQDVIARRFPNGVPAVSDASMSVWMEYVYMQKPCPANATGVEVTIDAIDPNNNFIHIGTATSDASGTFGYAWTTPNVPGKYTVIATFAGSEGYWPSYAETYTFVSEAPAATPPPEKIVFPPTETYIIGATIAIIIAIAIVGILILRKRP